MIRLAKPEDSKHIIPLMMEAIGTIAFDLSGTENIETTVDVLEQYFLQSGNRLSWDNSIVWEQDGVPLGYALFYEGSNVIALDQPLEARLSELRGEPVQLVKEALPGEFYLDSLAVDASQRGQGIGKQLMAAFEDEARTRGLSKASLLVNVANNRAKQLYEVQGYEGDGLVITIAGEHYEHMVKKV
ncbi:GNAT family N-acetyltransferase [Paenibacillus sp. ACRRX]|uniref:GNAT family N-acetyltransferase n=1 Tax=Paenibacillus sp. ACRRX TaxID=2918206 RepID=UPI001EF4F5D3|nr:GNAT family N-acetyltransferase [Paenibacillus sp. ACRRX]MCG7406144.1 GNAT family N-acetyltransferase [Paenibacillus sp. ACRRX]